jgi:hypothetical protein
MKVILVFAVVVFGLCAGCSDDSTNPSENGNGRMKIYMVDSPSLYDSVVVCVSRVEVHSAAGDSSSGWFTINDSLRYFDLLLLANGASVVLGDTSLPAGHYTQIRLILATGSYVVVSGVKHDLTVPSGLETGIKLTHQFTIESGMTYELMLDFDAESSIVITGTGEYQLKPTIRIIPVELSGSISGLIMPLDAEPLIMTVKGSDTISTYTDLLGYFKLMGLTEGSFDVTIVPANINYRDTVISSVQVTALQDTDIGVILLGSN